MYKLKKQGVLQFHSLCFTAVTARNTNKYSLINVSRYKYPIKKLAENCIA